MTERHTGTIKKFFAEAGFGFVTPDAPGRDVFLHASKLKEAGIELVAEGDRIEYSIIDGKRPGEVQAGEIVLLCRADGAAAVQLFKPAPRYGNVLPPE